MLIVGIVLGLFLCRSCSTPERVEIVQIDSVVRVDTVREYYPIERERVVIDTTLIVVRDTLRVKDTLYMNLPLEKRMYASSEYYAEVSGYRPCLDYIEVYPRTTIITRSETVQPSKWSFSADLGLDIGKGHSAYLSPNLGLEVRYDRWSLVGEIGVGVEAENRVIQSPYFYYQAGLRYNLYRR